MSIKPFALSYGHDFGIEAHLSVGDIEICTAPDAVTTLSTDDARELVAWLTKAIESENPQQQKISIRTTGADVVVEVDGTIAQSFDHIEDNLRDATLRAEAFADGLRFAQNMMKKK